MHVQGNAMLHDQGGHPVVTMVNFVLLAACGLPEDRGPCSNYSVRWYFNPVYGDCSRFWYGGCNGNDNRFANKEECQARCTTPAGDLGKLTWHLRD